MLNIKNTVNFDKTYLYTTIALAFILPLSKAGISFLTIFLSILWILEGDFKRKFNEIKSSKLLLSFLAYLTFSLISILWTNNIETALNIVQRNMIWLVIFVMATSLKKEHIQTIITAFLAGMFLSEIIAYGVFFEIWTFKNASPENPTPIMSHMEYSTYMAFASLLLLNRIFANHYSNKEKFVFFLFFLTVTGNLFLSTGRTGQVALIAGIIVLTIIHFRLSFKSLGMSILLLFTIFTTAYNLSEAFKIRVIYTYENLQRLSNLDFDSSWGTRAAYWITTYEIFKENPIIGVGLGDYIEATKVEIENEKYSYIHPTRREFMTTHHPHNQYLLVALQMGAVGLFLLFYFIFRILRQKIEDPEIKELSILFVTIFFVASMAEPLLLKQFTLALFVFYAGIFSIFSVNKTNSLGNKNAV